MFDNEEDDYDWERELEAIRQRHYEETKDMTPEEWAEYIHREATPIMVERGWKYAEPPVKAKPELVDA